MTRHILPKSPLAPLCQIPRNAGLPLAKGGEEGFSFKRLYNYGLINNRNDLSLKGFPGKTIRIVGGVCASASLAGKDSVNEASVAEEFNRLY